MKKRIFIFTLAICLILPCALMLTACGGNTPPHTHNFSQELSTNATHHWQECDGCEEKNNNVEHTFNQEIVEAQYLKSVANCVSPAIYFKSCICGVKGTETFENGTINATNHTFGPVSYDWSADNATCTATRECTNPNCEHEEHETVDSQSQVVQAQSCVNEELRTYTAEFENEDFSTQTKENVQKEPALGHSFGPVSYDWSADNATCTATRECTNPNCEHEEHETANSQYQITQQKSCVNEELRTYTVEFENEDFSTQTKENVQKEPALGHDFANGTFVVTDANHHWKKCSRCEAEDTENKQAHDFTGDWLTDGTDHWKECEICGKIQEKIAHTFDQEIQSAEYLKVSATCEIKGEYYHSCVCGEKGETTFETARLTHSYQDGACVHCGATDGILFSPYGGVTGYTGTATNVVIPKYSNDGKLNTDIKFNAFLGKTNIESVTLPESITLLDRAFYGCTNLQTINLNNVTKIKSSSFYNCLKLNNVSLDSLTELQSNAFENCKSLTSITFPNSLQVIKSSCFWGCTSLANINFGTGITTIENHAFLRCSALQSVVIPDSVTTLGDSVFEECSNLANVTLSANLTGEIRGVFGNCTSLESITIPAGVTIIGYECFDCCSNLSEVIFAEGSHLVTIGASAFYGTALTIITLPNTVTSVGYRAFGMCKSLTHIDFGTSLQTLEYEVFYNISALREISLPASVTSIPESFLSHKTNLTQINYSGTEAQWNALTKGANWNHNTGNYVVMCSDSEEGLAKQTYVDVFFYIEPYEEYCSFAILPNQTIAIPTPPTKEGSTFEGWFKSADYGATLAETAFDFETPITADTFIYAKWTAVE